MRLNKFRTSLISFAVATIVPACGDDATPAATDTAAGSDTMSGSDTATTEDTATSTDTTAEDTTAGDVAQVAPVLTAQLQVIYTYNGQEPQMLQNVSCLNIPPTLNSAGFEIDEGADKTFIFSCFFSVGQEPWRVGFGAFNPVAPFNRVAALPQSGRPELLAEAQSMENLWNVGTGSPDFAVRIILSEYSSAERRAVGTIDYTNRAFSIENPALPTFNVNGPFTATW